MAALRFRYAPPTVSHGAGGNLALTINADHSLGAGQLDTANAVATTLIQTEKYGTPLASALRVLSVEFRHTRMMQAEAKAARLPVLMTIPMMVFLVPPIFVVLVAPAACSMMEHGL